MQHHKWSLSDMDNLIPWERYIYVDLLQAYLKEEEQKAKDRENELKAKIKHANKIGRAHV